MSMSMLQGIKRLCVRSRVGSPLSMPLIYVESDEVHDNFGDLSQPVINSSSTTNNE